MITYNLHQFTLSRRILCIQRGFQGCWAISNVAYVVDDFLGILIKTGDANQFLFFVWCCVSVAIDVDSPQTNNH